LSETPTTETVTPATATGEKMIPLSAVFPLLEAIRRAWIDGASLPRMVLLEYDRIAAPQQYPPSADPTMGGRWP